MTVAELAEKSGLNRVHLYQLEAGKRAPDFATVQKVCKGLGVGLEAFQGVKNDR